MAKGNVVYISSTTTYQTCVNLCLCVKAFAPFPRILLFSPFFLGSSVRKLEWGSGWSFLVHLCILFAFCLFWSLTAVCWPVKLNSSSTAWETSSSHSYPAAQLPYWFWCRVECSTMLDREPLCGTAVLWCRTVLVVTACKRNSMLDRGPRWEQYHVGCSTVLAVEPSRRGHVGGPAVITECCTGFLRGCSREPRTKCLL